MSLPSKMKLRCSGISVSFSFFLHSIDYDVYNVQKEEDIYQVHDLLSSSKHRTEVETAVTLLWISFPLLLVALDGLQKLGKTIFKSTPGESFVYLFEKSFILLIGTVCIILPALSLVSVSYEWSFDETTAGNAVPTGYYIQFYILMFQYELVDCVAIADATFMVSLFILDRIVLYSAKRGNNKLQKFREVFNPEICIKIKGCCEVINSCCVLGLVIVFCIVLFEFAASGFFSPFGYAKFLTIWSFVVKMATGARIINLSRSSNYDQLEREFKNIATDQEVLKDDNKDNQAYAMTRIADQEI